jgi:hypothetical protein
MRVSAVAKFIIAALAVLADGIKVAVTDGAITSTEAVEIALAVLVALGVYIVPNNPDPDA